MIYRLAKWLYRSCCGMCDAVMWPWQATYTIHDRTRQHTACRVAFNAKRATLYGDAVKPIDA